MTLKTNLPQYYWKVLHGDRQLLPSVPWCPLYYHSFPSHLFKVNWQVKTLEPVKNRASRSVGPKNLKNANFWRKFNGW